MGNESNLPKITKGQRDALRMIISGDGTFHRITGDRLQRGGLAYPVSGIFNFLVGCNCRTAAGWVLTEIGEAFV